MLSSAPFETYQCPSSSALGLDGISDAVVEGSSVAVVDDRCAVDIDDNSSLGGDDLMGVDASSFRSRFENDDSDPVFGVFLDRLLRKNHRTPAMRTTKARTPKATPRPTASFAFWLRVPESVVGRAAVTCAVGEVEEVEGAVEEEVEDGVEESVEDDSVVARFHPFS